jgi:UDPglucose 6-dehydrogenase
VGERSRIFIVGSGAVGTATGCALADAGHRVTFIDVSADRLGQLRDRGMDAHDRLDLVEEPSSIIFLTLPTRHEDDRYDLTAFAAGAAAVGEALREATARHTVVVRSTVPPGTTEGLVRSLLEQRSGKRLGVGFDLASNPEFGPATGADDDVTHRRMTVVASRDQRTRDRIRGLLCPSGGEVRTFDNPTSAEFVKCADTIFNATKISFWNEMWLVAQHLGLDLDEISSTVARSAEGSINPRYGIRGGAPYGGTCLPRDTIGFLGFAGTLGVDMPLLSAVVEVNDRLVTMGVRELDTRTGDGLGGRQPARGTAAGAFGGVGNTQPAGREKPSGCWSARGTAARGRQIA